MRSLLALLCLVCALCGWYYVAANYDYDWLAGRYVSEGSGARCTLVLHKDRTFHQELLQGQTKQVADGTWHRIGEGGVSFSSNFLRVPGAKRFEEEFTESNGTEEDKEFFGEFLKVATLYPTIRLNRDRNGPVFYKHYFR